VRKVRVEGCNRLQSLLCGGHEFSSGHSDYYLMPAARAGRAAAAMCALHFPHIGFPWLKIGQLWRTIITQSLAVQGIHRLA